MRGSNRLAGWVEPIDSHSNCQMHWLPMFTPGKFWCFSSCYQAYPLVALSESLYDAQKYLVLSRHRSITHLLFQLETLDHVSESLSGRPNSEYAEAMLDVLHARQSSTQAPTGNPSSVHTRAYSQTIPSTTTLAWLPKRFSF